MPGPGKRKTKGKKSNGAGRDLSNVNIPNVLDAFIDEINDARDWDAVVHLLCKMFDLPDMETRSGLKRIHANFDAVQKNLDAAYLKYSDNEKVIGGIVGIWAGMCMDSLLRNRLFRAGLVEKILPLFDKRATRHVGLQALSAVTHHGGPEVRIEIARFTPTLVRLMEEFPDDRRVNELVIVTLAHTVSAVVNDEDASEAAKKLRMRNLDMPAILRLVLRNMRDPSASGYLLGHALSLLSGVAETYSKELKAIPSLVNVLIACLRSSELSIRAGSMTGLFCLVSSEAVVDNGNLDPQKFMAALQKGFPSELSEPLMAYNPTQCDTYVILQASVEFQKAMQRCVQDRNLYALGDKLADLILRTEFAISDGLYQTMNERTGQWEPVDTGLPFMMWGDALPHCAKAMRAKGSPSDLDKADILDCKYHIKKQQLPVALALAHKAIERSPQVAYFYYVVGLATKDNSEGLRASKKGLKCRQTTSFVKNYLLWRGTEHAANMGLGKLQASAAGDAGYSEGIAFLTSALDDAKVFVAEASPDTRHMSSMLSWYMLLSIALRGPEISPNLAEFDDSFRKLDLTRKFSEMFGTHQVGTQIRLTRELVTKHYQTAFQEWKPLIERLDKLHSTGDMQHKLTIKAEDNLSAWLEGLGVDDGEHDGHKKCSNPKLSAHMVELYRCSYCGNPSAVLRKCSGCARTRYCDSSCQKMHWSEHKVACKKAQAQAL